MSETSDNMQKHITLPPDFVAFMQKNYEIIEDIERKVKQFQISSDELTPYHRLRQAQFKKIFDSVDSCFSDSDVGKVISAYVKPKARAIDAREDRIQIDSINNLESKDNFNPDLEDYTYVSKKFPLICLSYEASDRNNQNFEDSFPLIVNGVPLTFSERLAYQQQQGNKSYNLQKQNFISSNARMRQNMSFSQSKHSYKSENKDSRKIAYICTCQCHNYEVKSATSFRLKNKKYCQGKGKVNANEEIENCSVSDNLGNPFAYSRQEGLVNQFSASDDGYKLKSQDKAVKTNKNLLSLSNESQLTLPPLHSSVLTLLGQRGGLKPSPRGLLGQIHEQSVSSGGANRQKKLRRHGRKKKNDKPEGSDEPTEAVRSASMKPMTQDEINETQMSAFIPEDNLESEEETSRNRFSEEKLQASMHNLVESRRALFYVLEDYIGGKPWSTKEMKELESEISSLSNYFDRYTTKFNVEDIRMKQDAWLSFPRTWSRASASFGVPHDIKSLREMTPLKYLTTCVNISEARRHLYDMVFQRYRMKENPTGSHISIKMLMAAVQEVIGRDMSAAEMDELCFTYLGIKDFEIQIDKQMFAGISAFCERIYAMYSSEDMNECFTCDRKDIKKDKQRCHQNQKSLLERTDLAFLSAKIRDGQVQSQLSKLLHALCERD